MKVILLHTIQSEKIGGTTTVINEIADSYLNKKFNFKRLIQSDACGLNPFKAFLFVNKYRKLIKQKHADTIYVCGLLYSGFLITLAAKFAGIKIILSIHGSEWDKSNQPSLKRFLFCQIIEPATVRMADQVFTVCKHGLNNIAIKKGGHNNIYGVIYNQMPNIDPEKYAKGLFRNEIGCPNDKLLIAVVGRVVEDKGHAYIIDAIKKLNDDSFVFVIVGDGDYLDNYKNMLPEMIKNRTLHLLGQRNDVFQILKDADIFLFATLHENHSKSMLEAICMKCAVICTNVGGNTEIIDDGETGLLMPSCDSDAIVNNLLRLKDESLRERLTLNAFVDNKQKYSLENTIGELGSLFESVTT